LQQDEGCKERLTKLAANADLMIMDAQYFPEEYPSRRGFGHSTPADAIELAVAAGVKHLLLTHHDPSHDDQRLDEKLALARQIANGRILVDNAHDRLQLSIPTHQEKLACA
jgi:ribonuclease BN (tRNA processing enzyme)